MYYYKLCPPFIICTSRYPSTDYISASPAFFPLTIVNLQILFLFSFKYFR